MLSRTSLGLAVLALLTAVTVYAADEIKLDGVKCFVNPKAAAKAANAVDYKGGKVFFCCMNCPKAFAKDTAKFATSANNQLAATGQAKQVACPYTGKDVAAGTEVKVGGVSVGFCCDMCKGKTEKAGDAAVEMVFNDKSFEKGFKVGEKK
jgi:YHS domain-containing protein